MQSVDMHFLASRDPPTLYFLILWEQLCLKIHQLVQDFTTKLIISLETIWSYVLNLISYHVLRLFKFNLLFSKQCNQPYCFWDFP